MPQANSTTSWPRATSPSGVGEHLAVLGGDDRGELVLAGVEQLAEREQHLGAPGQRGVPPRREGRLRGRDDVLAVGRGGQGELGGHLAGGRVGDVGEPVGAALEHGAVGPVVECLGHRWYPLSVQKMA